MSFGTRSSSVGDSALRWALVALMALLLPSAIWMLATVRPYLERRRSMAAAAASA